VAASNFDTTRLRLGDLVAGISGLVLLISLWLHWYSASAKGLLGQSVSGGISGWQILSFIDILLFLIALLAIAVAVIRMANAALRLPASPGLIVLAAGALATLLVLFRLLVLPGDLGDVNDIPGVDVGRSFGIFLALLASLGVAAGGWMTWNDEGKPRPSGAGTPVGAGQPYGGQPPAGGYQQQQAAAAPPAAAAPGAGAAAAAPPAAAPAAAETPAGGDAPPPGGAADWYPDPRGEKRLRYWDGSQWTHHTAD
jgi:Protein of unknown function (DUF2510)